MDDKGMVCSNILTDSDYKSDILMLIADKSRDAIFYTDITGKILCWNQSAKNIFGYTEEEAIGNYIFDLILTPEYQDEFKNIFSDEIIVISKNIHDSIYKIYAKTKDGNSFPCEIKLSVIIPNGTSYICGFARDVSERINAEEHFSKLIHEILSSKEAIEKQASEQLRITRELSEIQEKLKENLVQRDKFFSIIAHDLKSPFHGLLGFSEILARNIEILDKEEIKQSAKYMHEAVLHLFNMLENLLEWSRIQRGMISFNPVKINLLDSINRCIALLSQQIKQKEQSIVHNVPSDIFIYCDLNILNSVLKNIIENAVKFSYPKGMINITARDADSGNVEIIISDEGIGMDDKTVNEIFKIDSKSTKNGTANEKGTGLGLIICKELIEKSNGTIRVESKISIGSKFMVTLPKGE
jgi:PAS domain S-box-containing protein